MQDIITTNILRFSELNSTNEFAKELAKTISEKSSLEWTIVVADLQTKGKGRMGKSWYSPEGGLWASIIFSPTLPMSTSLLAGVAVCEAARELEVDAKIKWPNDILINNKKVAGILVEFEGNAVVLGIGINLNIKEFPPEISSTATSLYLEKGKPFVNEEVLELVINKLKEKYALIETNGVQKLLEAWRNYSVGLGKAVIVETPSGIIQGKAIDIDVDGALLLKLTNGNTQRILAGECRIKE